MEGVCRKPMVGIDLHRRRSVIVRAAADGEVLETALEATYGRRWTVNFLRVGGARHPGTMFPRSRAPS